LIAAVGFGLLFVATLWLTATIRPELDDSSFIIAMAILGVGMGLLAAQLANVAQSSVGDTERAEVGGLQYTAQNLGSSLGTALIGSVVVGALTATALTSVQDDPRVSDAVEQQVGVAVTGGVSFVPIQQIREALEAAQVPPAEVAAITQTYAEAQLQALKIALLVAAAIALLSLFLTRRLPRERLATRAGEPTAAPAQQEQPNVGRPDTGVDDDGQARAAPRLGRSSQQP
jgi:dipeptide/tripeptide permease